MAGSMRLYGQLSPVVVCLRQRRYELIDGSDVGTRFTGAMSVSSFRVEPCFMLYPSRYKTAFASSDLSMPSLHGPALRSACHTSRMAD